MKTKVKNQDLKIETIYLLIILSVKMRTKNLVIKN